MYQAIEPEVMTTRVSGTCSLMTTFKVWGNCFSKLTEATHGFFLRPASTFSSSRLRRVEPESTLRSFWMSSEVTWVVGSASTSSMEKTEESRSKTRARRATRPSAKTPAMTPMTTFIDWARWCLSRRSLPVTGPEPRRAATGLATDAPAAAAGFLLLRNDGMEPAAGALAAGRAVGRADGRAVGLAAGRAAARPPAARGVAARLDGAA